MDRIYSKALQDHHDHHRQMALVAGPRQVGKTTACRSAFKSPIYLNWDHDPDRDLIVKGSGALAARLDLDTAKPTQPFLILDEIHKYGRWKNLLKGFFDHYEKRVHITVTGSSRLDVFKRGGDSLMGRYFLYRIHPLSVGELNSPKLLESELRMPSKISASAWEHLWEFGGFPEPLFRGEKRFHTRWKKLRFEQVFQEDIRDLSQVQELGRIQILARLLESQAGQTTSYTTLADKVRVSVDTIRRWIGVLESFYFCHVVRPWSQNVTKSLIKEPKIYLYDWSVLTDPGARFENMVAAHLLKSVQLWMDLGMGDYALHYLRDKTGREVDFLVVKDGQPWFLVEAKLSGNRSLSPELFHFQKQTGAKHAFQIAYDLPYQELDCFRENTPRIVSAKTLLSQLV